MAGSKSIFWNLPILLGMNIIDYIKLPFRKDKDFYIELYKILGFLPHDISYYKLALMHKSIAHRNAKGKPVNNERLEFLGDAILDATVGHIVYEHFPGKKEGFLTNTRSKLVQRETLGRLAAEMGITRLILSSGRSASHNSYMGGNAFEALVGALYLDHGYDACMTFVKKKILSKMVNIDKVAYKEVNFKSKLIEWTQKNKVTMEFRCLRQYKDENGSPVFEYVCVLENIAACEGKGFSKKEAQQHAAEDTLRKLRKQPKFCEEVFLAKTERTKMEEQPVMVAPDLDKIAEEEKDFLVVKELDAECEGISENGPEQAAPCRPSSVEEKGKLTVTEQPAPSEDSGMSCDELEIDFSEVSGEKREMSREEIIAAAEAAAFEEEHASC